MSTISFTSNKQGVQDLLAALPAPAKPPVERAGADDLGSEPKQGFNDLLRDSSDAQQPAARPEAAEASEAAPRAESGQGDDGAASEGPEAVEQDASASDTSEGETAETSSDGSEEQGVEASSSEDDQTQPQDTSEEAQVQAAANAAAQLTAIGNVVSDQVKAQVQGGPGTQVDLTLAADGSGAEKSSQQAHAVSKDAQPSAAFQSQLPGNATGPVTQGGADAVAQPIIQQGGLAQNNTGDSGGESKSTAASQAANAAASTSSNAAATTAFALPDQASGEARLPLNPTATLQSADAARQAQAQPALPVGDNDGLNTARLTRGLANAVQQRGGAVTLRLTPPEMGTVRIQMQITGTSVSASFHAESTSAQTLLTTQLAQLRSSLESKGMSVDRLSVQPLAATAQSNNANQSQNQGDTQQQGQSQQGGNDGRSRGQYNGNASGQQSPDEQQDGGASGQGPRGFFDQLTDRAGEQAA